MHKESLTETQKGSDESQDDTEKLITDIDLLIGRIKQLRICIALYLLSNYSTNCSKKISVPPTPLRGWEERPAPIRA